MEKLTVTYENLNSRRVLQSRSL